MSGRGRIIGFGQAAAGAFYEVKGFADVPITVYFVVAAGWLCLLTWCFLSGKFAARMPNCRSLPMTSPPMAYGRRSCLMLTAR